MESKLTARDVPKHLRAGYKGRKFRLVVTDAVTIPMDSGLWSGGSREKWELVRLADGASVQDPVTQSSPWNGARSDRRVTLVPGFAVRVLSMFCGTDCGLTFYVCAQDGALTTGAHFAQVADRFGRDVANRYQAIDSKAVRS